MHVHEIQPPIHLSSLARAGPCGAPQAVRGGAEGGPAGGCETEQGSGCTARRSAEASGGVTEGGGKDERCHQRETEPQHLHQAAEPRAGGATQQTPSGR